jgi:hypothetical protein
MREPEVEGGTPTGFSENLVKSIITFLANKTCHFLTDNATEVQLVTALKYRVVGSGPQH